MATTTDLGNVNIFSSLASFNSNKANLKSNDLNFIKQTAAEMATVGGGIVDELLKKNGYVKFANGLILQWGYTEKNTVTLPIAYTKYCCVATSVSWGYTGVEIENLKALILKDTHSVNSWQYITVGI